MQLSLSYTMSDLDDILPPGSYKLDLVDRAGMPLGVTIDVEIGILRNAGPGESQDLDAGSVWLSAGASDVRYLLEANVRSTQLAFQHNQCTLEAGLRVADTLREGFPITVTFDPNASIADVHASLADRNGPVDVAVSSPQAPATTFSQGNVVALLPRHALSPGMTYRANVAYTVDGAPTQLVWEFSTAPARPFDPRLPPPAPGTAIGVAGIVDSACSMKLCDDEAHPRCKEHIELAFAPTSPTKAVQIEVFNPGSDRQKLLGLVGRSIEVLGVVDSSSIGLVTLALDDARSLVIDDDQLPVINADALTPYDVDSVVWIT